MPKAPTRETPHSTTPISSRHRLTLALAVAFLAVVLFSRLGLSPRHWRSIDPLMTTQEIAIRLGPPHAHSTNFMRWREPHLLGDWELIVACQEQQVARVERQFRWFGRRADRTYTPQGSTRTR